MADIFVSYTSSDQGWAFWIGQELERLGHTPHIDDWEISAGGDIAAWMEKRHNKADNVLLVVSSAYLTKGYSKWERLAAQWPAATERPNFALPVLIEECKVTTWLANIKRCDLFGLDEAGARARLEAYLKPAGKPAGPARFPGAEPLASARFPGKVKSEKSPAMRQEAVQHEGEGSEIQNGVSLPEAAPARTLKGLTTSLGILTAFLVALAGLIDAGVALVGKTPSMTCYFGLSLPWCPSLANRKVIEIPAIDFVNGTDVAEASGEVAGYGDVLMNARPYWERPNAAEWKVTSLGGKYQFSVQYATIEPRPVTILLNGRIWRQSALNAVTGGLKLESQLWFPLGEIVLSQGDNISRFQSNSVFPHLHTLKFTPLD